MKSIKLLIFPLIIFIYIFLLSVNLLSLPLYLDEGLYIFWSYLFSTDPSYAYISMQDGKTPLFMWLTTLSNQYFNNFLYSGRFVSVIASTISLVCWLIIATKITSKKIWPFLLIIFLATPFNILISRLAFVDSLLTAFGSLSILGLFLAKESIIKNQIPNSLIFTFFSGITLGLAFLTKSTAKIFLATLMVIIILWTLQFLKQKKFKSAGILITSSLIILFLYSEVLGYLRFGALRHWEMISNKESVLVFTLPELYRKFFIEFNYSTHLKNLPITIEYFRVYFGPILFFFFAGVIWIFKTKKHFWILIIISILSAGVFLSARVPASRYFAIIIPEVLVVSTIGLFWIWQKSKPLKIVSILLLIFSGFLSFKMIFTPLNAYYSRDDKSNFADNNLNALGLNESIEFLELKKENIAVAVTGIWGVTEGAQVAFKEKGIETYTTGRVVTNRLKEGEPCEEDFQELDNKCWKIDFGSLMNSTKNEKYVYFIDEDVDIETLKKLVNIEVVKEFKRPTNLNVYLIKLN